MISDLFSSSSSSLSSLELSDTKVYDPQIRPLSVPRRQQLDNIQTLTSLYQGRQIDKVDQQA